MAWYGLMMFFFSFSNWGLMVGDCRWSFFPGDCWIMLEERTESPGQDAPSNEDLSFVNDRWISRVEVTAIQMFVPGRVSGCWWLEHVFSFPRNIGNVIIPSDELTFFRGVESTNQVSSSFSINVTSKTAVASATCLTKLGFLGSHAGQQNCKLKLLNMMEMHDRSLKFGAFQIFEDTPRWVIQPPDPKGTPHSFQHLSAI